MGTSKDQSFQKKPKGFLGNKKSILQKDLKKILIQSRNKSRNLKTRFSRRQKTYQKTTQRPLLGMWWRTKSLWRNWRRT